MRKEHSRLPYETGETRVDVADRDDADAKPQANPKPMSPYAAFLLYLVAILGFVGVTLLMNSARPEAGRLGDEARAVRMRRRRRSTRSTSRRCRSSTTRVAVVFILFDLETVFLYVWALGAQPLTGFMLATFFLFRSCWC